MRQLGAKPDRRDGCSPIAPTEEAFTWPEGEVIFVPAAVGQLPGRSVVGATVMVRRLAAVLTILGKNHIGYRQITGCGRTSVWVGPADAHGLWLEFRQE